VRAGERSARIILVVGALLLIATLVWLPLVVISMGPAWIVAGVVVAEVLSLFGLPSRGKQSRPT
jgi:hypothetical protein